MDQKTHKLAYDSWHEGRTDGIAKDDPLRLPWHLTVYRHIRKRRISGEVLEIGCGTGSFALWLAARWGELSITAVDISPAAILIADSRTRRASQMLRYMVGDAQSLPLASASYDWVISCECIEHVPDPEAMAREIARILKPGGSFCLTTENYLNGMLLAWIHCWLTGRPFNSGSGIQPREHFFLFWRVRRLLQQAGLVVDSTESNHFQWLLLPRVDPAKLCTPNFKSKWARNIAKPFGRHFAFFGHKPFG